MAIFKVALALAMSWLVLAGTAMAAGMNFQLDSMLLTANDKGNGVFTVTSSSRETMYLEAEVVKVMVRNGQIEKVPFSRDNFPMWDLAVNPSKLVMRPGEAKSVAVKYLCQQNCERDEDLVYQVRFKPTAGPSEEEGQTVDIRFGMAPYYIIPAQEQLVEYDWDYNEIEQTVAVRNTGNTLIKIEVDNCNLGFMERKAEGSCRGVYPVLAGRHKLITLPEGLQGSNVQVTVANHDQSIERDFTL
ncbi:hypothetical protein C9I98_07220 [Photobacterium sanctipauli]|uniref:Molecular chaperone n=1 Tax=Photobacterium sanctipauli TaxID=1342794 RepID=A0A2T3NWM1_9GAMM|nr:hypothetical protein [Photobacterium sanctipauli]PSW20632.1 hypothetical protein C9I98_07220 [Photobacterium sanctipauli]